MVAQMLGQIRENAVVQVAVAKWIDYARHLENDDGAGNTKPFQDERKKAAPNVVDALNKAA